jgi:hypothetical protein
MRKRAGLSKAEIEIMEEEAKQSRFKNSDKLLVTSFTRFSLSLVTRYSLLIIRMGKINKEDLLNLPSRV